MNTGTIMCGNCGRVMDFQEGLSIYWGGIALCALCYQKHWGSIPPSTSTTLNTNFFPFNNKGWVCPKCGRVYSNATPECYHCNEEINHKETFKEGPKEMKKRNKLSDV